MMDAEVGEFDQMKHQVNAYFNANMPHYPVVNLPRVQPKLWTLYYSTLSG